MQLVRVMQDDDLGRVGRADRVGAVTLGRYQQLVGKLDGQPSLANLRRDCLGVVADPLDLDIDHLASGTEDGEGSPRKVA